MLGSAIPKRLVFSLTLVGLVSLLMFSDAWSIERASAQEGVGVTLTSVTSPSTSTYPADTVVVVSTSVKDENGFVNGTLANDNYAWTTTCGTVTAATTVPQTTFTAPSSACTGTISVNAYQDTSTTSTVNDDLADAVVGSATIDLINEASGYNTTATTLTLDDTTGIVAGNYIRHTDSEIMLVSSVTSGTVLVVTRGALGSTAAAILNNADIDLMTVTVDFAAADTTLTVTDGTQFAVGDYLEIGSEVVLVTAISTHDLTVTRAQFGTTAAAHSEAATVTKQVTASSSGTVQVNNPVAAEPAPTYTDPSPVPEIVPDGLTADDVAVIIPSAGGSFTEVGGTASITVPAGAVANGTAAAVGIVSVATSGLPSPPAAASEGASSGTFTFGSSAINVQWYDATGAAQATYSLNKPAEICLPFTQDDINGAAGGPDGLGIWRHNGTEWVTLNATANVGSGTVCGNASSFSSFALGLDVAAPGAATTGDSSAGDVSLPGTGGYTPTATTLMLMLMAGVALVVTGSITARRVLWTRDLS